MEVGELLVDARDNGMVEVGSAGHLEGTAVCVDQPQSVKCEQQHGFVLFYDHLKLTGQQTPNLDVPYPGVMFDSRSQGAKVNRQQVSTWGDVGEVLDRGVRCPKVSCHRNLVDNPVFPSGNLVTQQCNRGHEDSTAEPGTDDTRDAGQQIGGLVPEFGLIERG
jgi:hypothetical protein